MRALGMLCGVGSMLREAEDAGFKIVGNFETRTPFLTSREVWNTNFPKAKLLTGTLGVNLEVPGDWRNVELMLGHPPCNSYSALGNNVASLEMSAEEKAMRMERRSKRVGLAPLFTANVRLLQPRIFALDNLAKMLKTLTPEWWANECPGYQLSFIQMANWDYGTPQLRKRLWIVGVKGKRPFTLVPPKSRVPGPKTVWEAIGDLPWEPWSDQLEIAHVHKAPDSYPSGGYKTVDNPPTPPATVGDLAAGFLALAPKTLWPYRTATGRIARKIGRVRLHWNEKSGVLSGLETLHHPLTGWPLTPRERARLMQWPDSFHLNSPDRASFSRSDIMRLVLFTGKAVPSGFPRFLIPQLIKHLRSK